MRTELHVPSDLKFLGVVERWLLDTLEAEIGNQVDWSRQSSRLRLALVEAYSNVVRHAHHNRPDLPVILRLELKGRDLAIEIWDHGQGYDLSTYLAPSPEAMQEHGYGWLILNRLMDRVEYQLQVNGRNCLRLQANLMEDHSTQHSHCS
ncbi:anti-sigma regulatory factor [Leptolyngbya sp. FACHB-17]|uniref:ATP-binding protein n=1 Tax=unclassified Leptolyngbya TaxID=2650499 RepID=UPI00168128E7|nr:anti-sigma regulatory factor [Leptolyngbya sp. FACHB-17]MBD2079576.1 anti-sigma regulatory factor [Leptolyngbya sp. FACHB-17]